MSSIADFLDEKDQSEAANFLDEPSSSAVGDFATRAGQAAVTATGEAVSGIWRGADIVSTAVQKLGLHTAAALGVIPKKVADAGDQLMDMGFRITPEAQTLQEASQFGVEGGDAVKALAKEYHPDPARDKNVASSVAGFLGGLAPALASPGTALPVIVGQMGESTRDEAIAKGDAPDVADAKFTLGATAGAALGLAKVPGRAAAGAIEKLATHAAGGAVINAAADAGLQAAIDGQVDWGRVAKNGAVGAGLGVVLGVPELLALKKQFPAPGIGDLQSTLKGLPADDFLDGKTAESSTAELEGKTLGDAINQISGATGLHPTEIQRQINAAVGIPEEAAPAGAEGTLFAERLKREAGAAEAFGELTNSSPEVDAARPPADSAPNNPAFAGTLQALQELKAGVLGGDESIVLGEDPVRNQLTMAQTRPGDSAREQARLGAQLAAAEPQVSDGAVAPRVQMSPQASRMYGEYGGMDPKLMFAIGRAALGGAFGYATGDTPEERLGRALGFAGLGALASPALLRTLSNKIINAPVHPTILKDWGDSMNALKLRLAPQSILPPEIRDAARWGDQASNAIVYQGNALSADLQKAIRSVGDKAAQTVASDGVQAYLTGRITAAQLPPPLAGKAIKVRDYIDSLTDRAISEGVVQGNLAQTLASNRGSYLRRSYEMFANPNYEPSPAKVDAAIKYVQANGASAADAEATIAGLLDKNQRSAAGDFMVGRGKIAGKDVSVLMKRQDLAPEIRDLLGEIKDPIANIGQTIPRMAKLLEMDRTQKAIRDTGLKLGLFSQQQDLKYRAPLVSDANAPHDNFRGLYADPMIAAAFQKAASSGKASFVPEAIWKTLSTANYVAKIGKTIGSPAGYFPPLVHNLTAMIANGNFRMDALGRGVKLGLEEAGALRQFFPENPARPQLQAQAARLIKLGVFGNAVHANDLAATLDQSFWGKLSSTAKAPLDVAGKVYGFTDPVTKYAGFVSEMAKYGKAFPGLPAEELERKAAEVVMKTMPTYSRVPAFLRDFSRAGVVQPFINWHYELYRNIYNTFDVAQRDIREGAATGNKALAAIGAQRLAMATLTLGASSGAVGYGLYSRKANGVTDDQDKAVRFFGPPWLQNAALRYTGRVDQGQAKYSNLVYLMPYGAAMQAADAAMRGKTGVEAAKGFFSSLDEQILGSTPGFVPSMLGAAFGVDVSKRKEIPKTDLEPTLGDKLSFAWDKDFQPLVVPYVQRLGKAMRDEEDNYGRKFSVDEQLWRLGAVRGLTVDNAKNLDFKAAGLNRQFEDAESIFRSRVKQNLPPEKLDAVYQNSEAARQRVFGQMVQMRDYARALNIGDDRVIEGMRSAHVPPETILGVMDGRYTAQERTGKPSVSEIWAQMQQKTVEDRRTQLAQIYRDDPALGRSLVERWKDSARTGPMSSYDQTVKALGPDERATYLRNKLQAIQDPEGRRQLMQDGVRKGLITPQVMRLMTTAK